MKSSTLFFAAVAYAIGVASAFAIMRWIEKGDPEMAFVVGAILGTQTAIYLHFHTPSAENTLGAKAMVGVALALSAIVCGLLLHHFYAPFRHAEISIPISVVGSFFFPFGLFNIMWKNYVKTKKS